MHDVQVFGSGSHILHVVTHGTQFPWFVDEFITPIVPVGQFYLIKHVFWKL